MNDKFDSTFVYAARAKDKKILQTSSSGGMFTILSDYYINQGGAVSCAIYNYETDFVEFSLVTTKEHRDKAKGSKYIQSSCGNIFKESKQWLDENKNKSLMFIGMRCQSAGFVKYAEIMGVRDRVFVVDIICHGAPSPEIWKQYISMKKINGKISNISFKDKRNSWNNPTAVSNVNGKEVLLSQYVKLFYNKCILRPSCHKCPYATINRTVDMTIGDYWGIEKNHPEFYNSMGNSLVLIHSTKGVELFKNIKCNLDYILSDETKCLQPNLIKPTEKSQNRDVFWKQYKEKGIRYILKKYDAENLIFKIKRKLKRILIIYFDKVGGGK